MQSLPLSPSPEKENAPLKLAAKLWCELCQILTGEKNSFTIGKRTKSPTTLLRYNHPHLKHVATLPCNAFCKMQNYRKLCNKGAAKLWQNNFCQFLTDFEKFFITVKSIFSLLTRFFKFQLRLLTADSLRNHAQNCEKLKNLWKPKWCSVVRTKST